MSWKQVPERSKSIGLIEGLLYSAAAGMLVSLLAMVMFDAADVASPWIMVTVFGLPMLMAVNLRNKLGELREQDGLYASEKRRLCAIITHKQKNLSLVIVAYIVFAAIIGLALALTKSNLELLKAVLVFASALIGISAYSAWWIWRDFSEVEEFRGGIHDRLDMLKRRAAAIKNLRADDSKKDG